MQERYKISEMAHLLGVTTHMLRHYEKMGIIRPEVDPENGYRYYCVVDTRRFNLGRMLLACGFSLEQSAQIMKKVDQDELKELIERKIEEKEKEIIHAQQAIQYLKKMDRDYISLLSRVGKVWVENYPNMWRLEVSKKEIALSDPKLENQKRAWLENLPAVFWVSRIRREDLRRFPDGNAEYSYGLMCMEEDALKAGLEKTSDVEIIPGGDYIVTVHTKMLRGPYQWSDISALTDYIQKEEIRIFGDAFSYIAASQDTDNGHVNYHKVFLKIYS